MNRFRPKYKICFQSNKIIFHNINTEKLKKKKWFFLKKKIQDSKVIYEKPNTIKRIYKHKLIIKQQLKSFYGYLPEYQLKKLFKLSLKKKFNNFLIVLESRIDIVLYRLKISSTVLHIRQLIKHGNIKINNKIIYSNNYILKKGDIISFTKNNLFNNDKNTLIPLYLEFNYKLQKIIFIREPQIKEISYPFYINNDIIKSIFK